MKLRFSIHLVLIPAVFLAGVATVYAQKKDSVANKTSLDAFEIDDAFEAPLTINLDEEEEKKEEELKLKKKRKKKNVFYGLKSKKAFTSRGVGTREVIEVFYTLKEWKDPNPYVRDVYWYDTKSGKIKKTSNIRRDRARILHGPYKKMVGDLIVEEGFFYVGTKHGRWVRYNKNDILINKQYFHKGWAKDSKITYYDQERTKLKEVIPIEYGQINGYYYLFHENGQIAVRGGYVDGIKVGKWIENYDLKRKRQKEVQYKEDPYDEETQPYTIKEWDEEGKVVFERK